MRISFTAVFNVFMQCQDCADSVRKSLCDLDLESIEIDLASQTVTTTGALPPSSVISAIQNGGRDAILRGAGSANSAAVCILESFDTKDIELPVKGLARLVSIGNGFVLVDLTLNGLEKGIYFPQIRKSGNLSKGALSTGGLYHMLPLIQVSDPSDDGTKVHSLGAFSQPSVGLCSAKAFFEAKLNILDLIGRSLVLSTDADGVNASAICGVMARSAGVWENTKEVCSCTGKTVWQERKDAVNRGVLY